MGKRIINYDYAVLKEKYIEEKDKRKKYENEATTYYYQNIEYKKRINWLKEELKLKDKKIENLKLINTMLYEKIYKGE